MKKRQFFGLMTAFVMIFTMAFANTGFVFAASVSDLEADAQPMVIGTEYSAAWTKETVDKEYCGSVNVERAGVLNITATKPVDAQGNVKLSVMLYDENGKLVGGSDNVRSADTSAPVYLLSAGVMPGKYYITIKPGTASVEDTITTSYKVEFTEDKYCEREPNAVKTDATLMDPGKTYRGFFGTDGAYKADENDFYQFECIKGQSYRISIGNYSALKETATMIDLIDATGYEKIISIELGTSGSYNFNAAVTGTYYIKFSNCNTQQYEYSVKVDQTNPAGLANALRIAGNDRYDTAIAIAKKLKHEKQISKFDCIVVASGLNYPDALAGGCLAYEKDAPMLLVGTDTASEKKTETYIKENLKQGGTVYILGGTGVVTERFAKTLTGFKVSRLFGADRYATNLSILNKLEADSKNLLICTGEGYADSLSASAVGLPILLVKGNGLTTAQKQYVNKLNPENIYIIGGHGAVSQAMMNSLKTQGEWTVERVSGINRYATSVEVAKKFFPEGSSVIALAYAQNYPDGLSGGPLAMQFGAPLVLTDNVNYSYADSYATSAGATYALVYGGPAIISDNAVKNILN